MDTWCLEWARWVRRHEADVCRIEQPTPLRIDIHHLYYVLLHLEGLGAHVGPMDVVVDVPYPTRAPATEASQPQDTSDTKSILSLQQTIHTVSSWWYGDPSAETSAEPVWAYLRTVLPRVTSLAITSAPTSSNEELASYPGTHGTPLHFFTSLAHLALVGVEPCTILGWDRLCIQLTSLSCSYCHIPDVAGVCTDLVVRDASASTMPAAAWHALRCVALPYNELTFLDEASVQHWGHVTYLDVSHNLLNAVPPALAHIPHLRGLNICDNMVDSVLGIYDALPHICALNLSGNRLDSLCGMERLLSLRQVDVRHNQLYDPGEIGRLATLPHISHVWTAANPMLSMTREARIACFTAFAYEKKSILLDDTQPGFWEQRRIQALVAQRRASAPRRDSSVIEAHVASQARRVVKHPQDTAASPQLPPTPAPRRKRKSTSRLTVDDASAPLKQRIEQLRGAKGDDWLRVLAQEPSSEAPSYPVHAVDEPPISGFAWPFRSLLYVISTPLGAAAASAVTVCGGYFAWWRFFRRIPNAAYVTPAVLHSRRVLVGRVTHVGDADGFRLYHTPGLPFLRSWVYKPPTKAADLRQQTISVRLAGCDAPEAAHFGREGQPFADEAKAELKRLVEGRTVWLSLAHIDQYQRLVGTPYVWTWPYIFGKTNVSLSLVRQGLATVYRATGADYGPPTWLSRTLLRVQTGRRALERAEEHAKRSKLGMWSLGRRVETPAEYKQRQARSKS
ncbi:putative endonuclease Lcl3 [Malassezia pachydermatis]|uniref:Leucine rich repeat domain-containing protein n=1 Tax=Malassezia pachydermatis TaxID=77020 RepID=A0A0M9VQN1_9BASI|nr:leucine rich repeat domain-containing protein [Malassezia pachydermatis]KOS15693.1 leucine rich repeat domain-containing protein [Malassezia pachydermatis]